MSTAVRWKTHRKKGAGKTMRQKSGATKTPKPMQRFEKSQEADDRGVSRPAGETMKRELGQIIDLDDGEDADYDFLSQVADAESRALSSKAAAKRARPSFTAADGAGEVEPQVKGAYLAALRGDDAAGSWRERQSKSAGAGSRLKVVAADGANVGGDRLGLGGGGDNACFKCGKLGHWARDCDGAPVGGGAQSSEPQKACPCGLGDCLVLTANTEKNRGRRFYKCPVREVRVLIFAYWNVDQRMEIYVECLMI